VAELTRGTVFDRPWGRTLGSLGLRGLTGQLTLTALDGKLYEIAFSNGAVIGASSPVASDAAVRVALTGGLISTTQVAELARKQAAQAGRDEIEVISDHLRLGFDQAMRLRRRTIAQRAARSFSVDKGDFVVTDEITLPSVAGSELDIRAIIYIGARQNLSEARLAAELGLFGTWFRLKPEAFEDLPQFGFADQERPIIDQLLNGASLADLEAIVGIDVRQVRAALYALCAANACNVEQTRGQGTTKPPPASLKTDPNLRRSTGSQPPLSRPPEQPPTRPVRPGSSPPAGSGRAHRASQQPLVAYRPGMRRSGTTQPPPPNTTQTIVDANRPMGAAGNTMPPANVRRVTTTPPAGTEIPQPGHARAKSEPSAASEPGVVRSSGSNPGIARTTTTQPAVARTATPIPSRTATPPTGRMAAIQPPRTLTTPASTPPPLSRTQTPAGGRTLTTPVPTARTASASQPPRPRTASKLPGMQAPEVLALIAERAKLLDAHADHYAMLGVSPKAPGDEIRKTYFNLARSLHPDRLSALGIGDDTRTAHKVFAQLNMAFSVLSDAKRRADYDDLLDHGGESVQREEEQRAEEIALRILASEEHYKKGEMALKRDDLGTAIAELAKAVELNPDEADFAAAHAWAIFCATPEKSTIARQTRTALDRAIQRSPKSITPRFYLGRVLRMLGNDKEALDQFRSVLADKPHHHEAQSEVRAIEARLAGPPKGGGGLFGKKR
jgi:DnaJ domain